MRWIALKWPLRSPVDVYKRQDDEFDTIDIKKMDGDSYILSLIHILLERRAGISLASRDVYMNAVGGMRMAEPSGDLAVIAALASAALDMPLLEDTVFIGEVGLSLIHI